LSRWRMDSAAKSPRPSETINELLSLVTHEFATQMP
jgi:hypothetical protein